MRRPGEKKSGDPIQTTVATPEISEIFRDEVALPVALSPDGHFLIVYGRNAEGVPGLWLHDLGGGVFRLIAQSASSVGWSNDSKAIAYIADGKLKTLPVNGGPPRTICDARPEGTPSWYGDTILFTQFSVRDPGICRVNAAGGNAELIVATDRKPFGIPWWPQFLPDGKHFLYLVIGRSEAGEVRHELRMGSLEGGAAKKVSSAIDSRAIYVDGELLFARAGTLLAQPLDIDNV